jgi:hypothetical protein
MQTDDPRTYGADFSEVMLLINGWATLEPWLEPFCESLPDGRLYCFGNFVEFSGTFSFILTDPVDCERMSRALHEHMHSAEYLGHAAKRRRLVEERRARDRAARSR